MRISGVSSIWNALMITQGVTRYTMTTESIHYARFVSHLQYFAERFFSGKLMDSEDDFLFQQMQQNYPAAVTCAEKIRTFVLRKYGVFLPNEETAYLALHVARLTSGK